MTFKILWLYPLWSSTLFWYFFKRYFTPSTELGLCFKIYLKLIFFNGFEYLLEIGVNSFLLFSSISKPNKSIPKYLNLVPWIL